jgi:hypothetical protein
MNAVKYANHTIALVESVENKTLQKKIKTLYYLKKKDLTIHHTFNFSRHNISFSQSLLSEKRGGGGGGGEKKKKNPQKKVT